MARKDIHRPAEIRPADYRYLFSFSYPGVDGVPGINTALLSAVRTGKPAREPRWAVDHATGRVAPDGYVEVTSPWGKLPFFEKANGSGGCDVCGAHYRHGDAFLHNPSGEVILIGHICAGKMDLHCDRGDWTRRSRELAQLRKTAEYAKAKAERQEAIKAEAVEFLREEPGLEEALETEHGICRDLKEKLWRYGSLSEKQVALTRKLHAEANSPEAKEEKAAEIKPPAGRREVEGEVVSLKWVENDFGGTLKMLIQCGNGTGRFRLFGTVPGNLAVTEYDESGAQISAPPNPGARVRFTATIQPKEVGFGFFSRPAKAEIVEAS